jgi:hypothetical protein
MRLIFKKLNCQKLLILLSKVLHLRLDKKDETHYTPSVKQSIHHKITIF